MDNLKAKKRHPEEIAVYSAIYVCAAFSVLLLLGIIVYVFAKGARRVNWAFLTGVTSILHGTVGIAGNILNTLINNITYYDNYNANRCRCCDLFK